MADPRILVERAGKGDAEAFAELTARYRRLVYAICVSRVGQPAEAEDLTQETFVRVYHDLANLRDPEKFVPWLRRVARNVCGMWLRRRRASGVPLETVAEQEDPAAAARLRRSELGQLLNAVLAGISSNSREVLLMRYLGGCSEAEIAATLGLSPATVKSRLHEGRAQAKRELMPVVHELLSLETSSDEMVAEIMARCGSPGCACPDSLTGRR